MIKCTICGHAAHYIAPHLLESHGLSVEEYEGETVSPALEAAFAAHAKGRKRTPVGADHKLTTRFAGVELPVATDVPVEACLPMPEGYAVPRYGKLAAAVETAVKRLTGAKVRPVWIWGPPGTGKDAVVWALSARTRAPAVTFNISPSADVEGWIAVRALSDKGTHWEEGALLKALRDGYVTPSGRRVPYIVILSDLDRATRAQMEPLRAILDSLGGRIQGPDGRVHKVLPGTRVVATANTSGGGDTTGRYTSTPVDTSLMDRVNFAVTFHNMDSRDEEPIVRAKYSALCARFTEVPGVVMKATTAIRDAIVKGDLYMDFGHRTVCAWLDAIENESEFYGGRDASKVIRAGLQDVLAKCPNDETREQLKLLVDPHLKGGAVEEGDTSHISKDPIAF
jgi:MoxR-like ATPase